MTVFLARRTARTRTPGHRLTATSLAALLAGILIYLLWRLPGSAALLPPALQLALAPAPPLTGQLPAFLHAYAFTLLGVAALGASRTHAAIVAVAWTAVGSLLETGQMPAVAEPLSRALAGIAATGPVSAYFTGGTFDPLDICATALGALAACVTVALVLRKGGSHENEKTIRAA